MPSFGWIPDIPDRRDHVYTAPQPVLAALPASVDLRAECPSVWDQQALGSCTAHATGAAFEFEARHGGWDVWMPSRLFVYYCSRALAGNTEWDSGASLRDSIKALASTGVCREDLWPYVTAKFAVWPPATAYSAALPNRVTEYLRLAQDLDQLRGCLASGYPFVFGFSVYESFMSREVARTGIAPMPGPGERTLGGHACLAVGYDSAAQTFLCRNSWGAGWGISGHFQMPFTYLLSQSLSADFWTVRAIVEARPAPPVPPPVPPTPTPTPTPPPSPTPAPTPIPVTAPLITGIAPASGRAGTRILVTGTNLGTWGTLVVGGIRADTGSVYWADAAINATVPALAPGQYAIVAHRRQPDDAVSEPFPFTVEGVTPPPPPEPPPPPPPPEPPAVGIITGYEVNGVAALRARPGDVVAVLGTNLGVNGRLKFGDSHPPQEDIPPDSTGRPAAGAGCWWDDVLLRSEERWEVKVPPWNRDTVWHGTDHPLTIRQGWDDLGNGIWALGGQIFHVTWPAS